MEPPDLPDFPALQQLARSLWHQGTARGAAVLVGAGFSKHAVRTADDTPEAPLWSELADRMAERLYGGRPDKSWKDPLRITEEFRAFFGQAALDELIRQIVPAAALQPGPLHKALLDLEWSDVLTTDWDTLLERAAHTVGHRRYEPVIREADLVHTRAPRIVKLHGSIGATEHFIVAEEDYRTFPLRHAAFVNFARQVFIENELCLVGFSGDDPNFLQWSGWVRDHLGTNARRIYLVGVLDLAPATRKYLETRNIAPIDLAQWVRNERPDARHGIATRRLLDFLASRRPQLSHDWTPEPPSSYDFQPPTAETALREQRDPAFAASRLDKAAQAWRKDRSTYPGWLLCPAEKRHALHRGTIDWRINASVIDALPSAQRAKVLFEIGWRYRTALCPVAEDLTKLFASVADPANPTTLAAEESLEIAILLLSIARQNGDDAEFDRWAAVLAAHTEPDTDLGSWLPYEKALRARDRLDYPSVRAELDAICGPDPAWLLRRSGLLAEIGEDAASAALINRATTDLDQRQRTQPESLWTRSRRAWVERLSWAANIDRGPPPAPKEGLIRRFPVTQIDLPTAQAG